MSVHEQALAILNKHFPKFAYSDMDTGFYWKSLERYEPGDHITHNGTTYVVEYSWEWWKPHGIPVYMCEMRPAGTPSRRNTA